MNINIIKSAESAGKAKWLAVIIDVFRAFSVEGYLFDNGAKYIIPVQTLEEAYLLKKENPEYVLIGERWWIKPEWFDYGNSPTELVDKDFTNKVIVHTTSNGTKWLLLATQADEIITGSFVNAGAIIQYIQNNVKETISLVSTAHLDLEHNEDIMLAEYLRDTLEGKIISPDDVKKILKTTSTYSLLFDEIWVPLTDFDLCLDFNRFNFIIKKEIKDGKIILVKVNI